ncbi:MAG: hypothetical protein K940chlam7_01645 [Chlamydiae bacterium]|nr:hypothetical protein [Chlamydiota bacterium]
MRPFFQKPKSLVSSLVSVFLRPSGKRSAFLGSPKILTIEFPSYEVRSSEYTLSCWGDREGSEGSEEI